MKTDVLFLHVASSLALSVLIILIYSLNRVFTNLVCKTNNASDLFCIKCTYLYGLYLEGSSTMVSKTNFALWVASKKGAQMSQSESSDQKEIDNDFYEIKGNFENFGIEQIWQEWDWNFARKVKGKFISNNFEYMIRQVTKSII